MKKHNDFFGKWSKEVNKIIEKKSEKYPMLDKEKIRKFLINYTDFFRKRNKLKINGAFYKALVLFEATCETIKKHGVD